MEVLNKEIVQTRYAALVKKALLVMKNAIHTQRTAKLIRACLKDGIIVMNFSFKEQSF